MVSVAMATYNGCKYIREQLDSIVKQSILPEEIVIRDDGSTDQTMDIIDEYKKQYPNISWNVCRNETNLGYVKNFMETIKNCAGDIIILCDQDDVWRLDKIERTIEFFKDPKVLSLHGEIDIIDEQGEVIEKGRLGYANQKEYVPLNVFFRHIYYCGMSSAFRNELTPMMLQMDLDVLPTHDWLVHAVAVCKEGFYKSSEVLSYRRFHGDNVALNLNKGDREGIQQRIGVVEYYCRHYELLNTIYEKFGAKEKERTLAHMIYKVNSKRVEYLREKSIWKAVSNLKNLKYYPTKKAFFSDLLYLINVF